MIREDKVVIIEIFGEKQHTKTTPNKCHVSALHNKINPAKHTKIMSNYKWIRFKFEAFSKCRNV